VAASAGVNSVPGEFFDDLDAGADPMRSSGAEQGGGSSERADSSVGLTPALVPANAAEETDVFGVGASGG